MSRFLLQRMIHKKWMVISLLIGNILLISIAICFPLYRQASTRRMLPDEFTAYITENGCYPGVFYYSCTRKESNMERYQELKAMSVQSAERLKVPLLENIHVLQQSAVTADCLSDRPDVQELEVQPSCMTGLPEHITMISGDVYQRREDGIVEAIVSEAAFVELKLLLGDELKLRSVYWPDGTPVTVKITGVFTYSDNTDPYWVNAPDYYETALFIDETQFAEIYPEDNSAGVILTSYWYAVLDEEHLMPEDVNVLEQSTQGFIRDLEQAGAIVAEPRYLTVLDSYQSKEHRVMVTLLILHVPIIVLLCAFLFMIAGQMLSMEQNEISLLMSRGAGKGQLFLLYLLQSVLLNLISFLAALPLGMFLCRMLGSANAFLEFVQRRALEISVSAEVLLCALGAMGVSVLVTVLPVIRYSRISIVNLKQERSKVKKKLWEKLYLDVAALLVSLYGLYTFSIQKEELALRVMNGSSLDPLLYLSSSLFIAGAGLMALRLWPCFVKLIYTIGRKRWKPEEYASFLQIIRTGSRQQFIMEFLILTVALGIFNATVARTILSNAEINLHYQTGADVVMLEKWESNENEVAFGLADTLYYYEPDADRFLAIAGVENMARVLNRNASVSLTPEKTLDVRLLGITTNEFGRVVQDEGWNPYSLVKYLNVLASNPKAVLVSDNFRSIYNYQLGDEIVFFSEGSPVTGVIYGFFEFFPSYTPSEIVTLAGGAGRQENFLIVANLAALQNIMGVTPYELWFRMKDGNADSLINYIEENAVAIEAFESSAEEKQKLHNETLYQGTSGVLTMSFIVILILCGVGFLIYWILSIRERELLFGVLRAMGMSRNGIIRMLFNEQLFGSILFILVGAGIGALASILYVPLIQIAYTGQDQVLPLLLVTQTEDMVRLFVIIGIMFAVCMLILIRMVSGMRITNALKLGED